MSTDQIVAETVAQGRGHTIAQILHRSRLIASHEVTLERERAIVAALKATIPNWDDAAARMAEAVRDGELPAEYLEP